MSEDRRDKQTPETADHGADRREFLKKAGIAAGALALGGLGSFSEAQGPRPRPLPGPTLQLPRGGPLQLQLVNTTQQFAESFNMLKESGQAGPRASAAWNDPMAKLSPEGRIAGVAILELSQRQQPLPDVGKNIAVLFTMLANGMAKVEDPTDLRAAGNGCGSGCGYGCMAPVAGGFICGNNCGVSTGFTARVRPGVQQAGGGFICGNNCSGAGLQDLTIDLNGAVLSNVRFEGLNMTQVAGAMRNAAQAYGQVFG